MASKPNDEIRRQWDESMERAHQEALGATWRDRIESALKDALLTDAEGKKSVLVFKPGADGINAPAASAELKERILRMMQKLHEVNNMGGQQGSSLTEQDIKDLNMSVTAWDSAVNQKAVIHVSDGGINKYFIAPDVAFMILVPLIRSLGIDPVVKQKTTEDIYGIPDHQAAKTTITYQQFTDALLTKPNGKVSAEEAEILMRSVAESSEKSANGTYYLAPQKTLAALGIEEKWKECGIKTQLIDGKKYYQLAKPFAESSFIPELERISSKNYDDIMNETTRPGLSRDDDGKIAR